MGGATFLSGVRFGCVVLCVRVAQNPQKTTQRARTQTHTKRARRTPPALLQLTAPLHSHLAPSPLIAPPTLTPILFQPSTCWGDCSLHIVK
jgi:hypothetical protein